MTIRRAHSARPGLWRAGRWVCSLWLIGCGDDTKPADAKPEKPGMSAEPGDEPESESSGPAINAAAHDETIRSPLDATPSPKGERVYYTAFRHSEDEEVPGVFVTDAHGGGAIEMLAEGAPLTSPVNISISLDGQMLYVADTASGDKGRGAVLSLAANGGTPAVLPGTEDYSPAGLAIAELKGAEYLFFTGRHPDSGEAGVFRIDPAGGVADTVASGGPLSDPSGVVVSAGGDAYVVEANTEASSARVLRVRDGMVEGFVEDIGVGFPAGIALTKDDSTLLISGLDPMTRRDVVYIVDVASGKLSKLTKTVGEFSEPAGLHRAHEANVLAWADSQAESYGTVYTIKLDPISPTQPGSKTP
jgi:DNA-binding beta-propeller fold protein YncE